MARAKSCNISGRARASTATAAAPGGVLKGPEGLAPLSREPRLQVPNNTRLAAAQSGCYRTEPRTPARPAAAGSGRYCREVRTPERTADARTAPSTDTKAVLTGGEPARGFPVRRAKSMSCVEARSMEALLDQAETAATIMQKMVRGRSSRLQLAAKDPS